MRRGWPRARVEDTRDLLAQLVADGIWAGDPAVGMVLLEAEMFDRPSGEPVLVHGDLHIRHLLLDVEGHAGRVIDWGDVYLADPSVDLALGYTAFMRAVRAAFLDTYGGIDAEGALRARALGIRLSAFLAAYAADEDRPELLAETLTASGLGRERRTRRSRAPAVGGEQTTPGTGGELQLLGRAADRPWRRKTDCPWRSSPPTTCAAMGTEASRCEAGQPNGGRARLPQRLAGAALIGHRP
jgi:Phosphotransferase enzyme family